MEDTTTDTRTERIIALRNGGATLAAIGEDVGLTRERVRQILAEQGVRTMRHRDHLNAAAEAWRASGELRHPGDVAREHGIAPNGKNVAALRRACPELALPESKPGGSQWNLDAIAGIMRRIAAEQGIDPATGWIKIAEYDAWKGEGDPSVATIGANYLWSTIMDLAGFNAKNASRRGRRPGVGYRAFTQDDLDAAVLAYMDSHPSKVSSAGLEAFLEEHPEHPSMATVRNRARKRGITSIAGIFQDVIDRHATG